MGGASLEVEWSALTRLGSPDLCSRQESQPESEPEPEPEVEPEAEPNVTTETNSSS